jgi:hypothetical protein
MSLLFPFILVALCLVAVAVTWFAATCARHSMRAARWPTTPGTLANLELVERDNDDSRVYEVRVGYTYTVDGTLYEGDRLAYGYFASSRKDAHAEVFQRLKEAEQIDVRYDPSDPSSSCLSFGMNGWIRGAAALAAAAWAFLAAAAVMWWFFMSTGQDAVLLKNLSVQ